MRKLIIHTIPISLIILSAVILLFYQNCGGFKVANVASLAPSNDLPFNFVPIVDDPNDPWLNNIFSESYIHKTNNFDSDPQWVGVANISNDSLCDTVVQNYGYSSTNNTGLGQGEIGGTISRSFTESHYGDDIGHLSFDNSLHASGTFYIRSQVGDSGVFIGWFNNSFHGWRPPHFLGMYLNSYTNGVRAWVSYGTSQWEAIALPVKDIDDDFQSHSFQMDYTPTGGDGYGVLTVRVDDTSISLNVRDFHRRSNADFNRFGIFNIGRPVGGAMDIYFDNFTYDAQSGRRYQDFSADPRWEESKTRVSFRDCEAQMNQMFGFSSQKKVIGGVLWRMPPTTAAPIYADTVTGLGFNDYLEASGRIQLELATVDSGFLFGWFENEFFVGAEGGDLAGARNIIGVMVEGPTDRGHFFRPIIKGEGGSVLIESLGPVILPNNNIIEWRIVYDPDFNNTGGVKIYIGDKTASLTLPEGYKSRAGNFTHFGMFPLRYSGGGAVKVYFDNLKYISSKK